jgi:5-methylcytosine-specific restriction protein A
MSADARYDDNRASARARLYTARWDRAAQAFKARRPLCLGCEARGEVTPTAVVDHVIPHKGDAVLFWSRELWQPACRFDHDVVKQRLELMYARGAIVAADLWLDSSVAIALAKQQRASIGDDGWPVE